jgi:hypothetical protein
MAQDGDLGSAYLTALKGSAPAPSPSHGPSAASSAANPSPRSPAEKRRSPRYKCEGSADIREDGCDVRTWATFSDISLEGCYVEAQATYPAGTLLNMKLDINDIHVETRGLVRVNYPYLGMGIAFTGTSEDNIAALRRMIVSVSRPGLTMSPAIATPMASHPRDVVPVITDPVAAIRALVEFFEGRPTLVREEFLRILRRSQIAPASSGASRDTR